MSKVSLILLIVGAAMGIPQWGSIFGSMGIGASVIGLTIQAFGVGIAVANMCHIIKDSPRKV